MTPAPKKVEERLASSVKHFQPVLTSAKSRDVNESDTVIIVSGGQDGMQSGRLKMDRVF